MTTPRDPAAPAAPNETMDDTTQPDASTSATDLQVTEGSVGLSTGHSGHSGPSDSNNEENQSPQAGDASSAPSRGPVAQTPMPTNDALSAAMASENEHQNTPDDDQNTELDNLNIDTPARGEHGAANAESASAVSTTLPIRTSSVRTTSQAVSAQVAASPSSNSGRDSSPLTQFIGPDGHVVNLATIMHPHRSTSIAESTPRLSTGRRSSLRQQFPPRERTQRYRRDTPEFVVPRWQPDAEVTLCPICNTQFSIWVRKHHCRCVARRHST